MLSSILFWGVTIIALASYALLLLVFTISKKDRQIKAFMPVLLCLMGWTGSSLLMKLDTAPGFAFWNTLLVSFMLAVPAVIYHFVIVLTNSEKRKVSLFWYLGTVAIVALNAAGVFVGDRTFSIVGGGMVSVGYTVNWTAAIPAVFVLALVLDTVFLLRSSAKAGRINRGTCIPIIVGLLLMFLGCAANLSPVVGQYPLDILMSLVNAVLFMKVIYSKRTFTLKFMLTRGLTFALIGTLFTIGLSFAGLYLDDFIATMLPVGDSYKIIRTAVVALLFAIALQIVYFLSKSVVDKFFVNSEYVRRQALRNFSVKIANNLDLEQILAELTGAVKEGVQSTGVFVLLHDPERECYYTARSGNVLENPEITISDNNPIISWMRENNSCLTLRQISGLPFFRSMWTSEKAILREYDIRLFVPLVSRESLIGMLFLAAPERGSEYSGEDMDVLQSLGTSSAIAIDNARMYDRAKRQAKTDELTGLFNRRSFYEDLENGVERARTEGTNLALILLDIDMFKLFNDMHGSYEGDLALRRIGRMVQSLVGMEGAAYRYGGQEFAVFLPCADGHRAHTVAELIRRSVEDDFLHHEDQTKRFLTVSGGVSVFPVTAKNADELIRRADFAKVTAKDEGKNRIHVYTAADADSTERGEGEMPFATTVYALAAAIDAKDHFTFSHSQKVADYVVSLALSLGMDNAQLPMLREAALLHDIGKIGVPESILVKPGRLTEEEYRTIKQHVVMSIEIIKHLPSLNYVIPTVLGHHERWDGNGYPRGISGDAIPIASRCLSVVDSFDAMISERPYKAAFTVEYALSEIEREAGHQFDPEVAETFVSLVRSGKITIQKQPPE